MGVGILNAVGVYLIVASAASWSFVRALVRSDEFESADDAAKAGLLLGMLWPVTVVAAVGLSLVSARADR